MKSWVFAAAMLVMFVPESGVSATYYIDFASGSDANAGTSKSSPLKYAPGMAGYTHTGYVHSAGDRFIFKGGVQWDNTVAPWNITNSGTSGNNDYYGVDRTWYNGAAWSQPIFDGGSQNPCPLPAYWNVTGSYITLDNLTLQNIGVAGINQGNYAIWMNNNHDYLIENMTLKVESKVAICIGNTTGAKLSNWEIKNNDISRCSWGIGGGVQNADSVVTNVRIHDNTFHDFHDQMASGAHGDGIYLAVTPMTIASEYMDQVYIYNNLFFGDFSPSDTSATGMTAFIWPSATAQGSTYVYNNLITYSAGAPSAVFWAGATFTGFTPTSSAYFYNNSALADANANQFLEASGIGSLIVENNIGVGTVYPYAIGVYANVSSFTSDYNDYYNWSHGSTGTFASVNGTVYNYAQFKAEGYEAHGLSGNPLFVSASNPFDLHLQPCSPVIHKGTNLSTSFTIDAQANPRPGPTGGAWDMGAYVRPVTPCPPFTHPTKAH